MIQCRFLQAVQFIVLPARCCLRGNVCTPNCQISNRLNCISKDEGLLCYFTSHAKKISYYADYKSLFNLFRTVFHFNTYFLTVVKCSFIIGWKLSMLWKKIQDVCLKCKYKYSIQEPKWNIMVIAQVFIIPTYQGLTSIYRFFPIQLQNYPCTFLRHRMLNKHRRFLFFCWRLWKAM